ncbi:LysM peptidoglycan-binding domain-containing protein [Metabacillus sp. RGM 3146]|uniref:C40 family peptidase n=1 Tax=Metabacillus sp. RGM 3146 TaxID=3401092 RepID=UPI003B9B3412
MKQKILGLTATAIVGSSVFASAAAAENITVKSGDSIWKLSKKYQTTAEAIKQANKLHSDSIYIGQVLNIPSSGTAHAASLTSPKKVTISSKGNSAKLELSHTVKLGDSLWVIARKYNTSVTELKLLNHLKGDIIYSGQVLKVKGKEQVKQVKAAVDEKPSSTETNMPATYKVKSGDSLWIIANKVKLTIQDIKTANNLKNDMIFPGQTLKLTKVSAAETDSSDSSNTDGRVSTVPSQDTNDQAVSSKVNKMIAEAKTLMGTPYRWAGNTPAGFDCSGFIYYVLNKVTSVSRLSAAGYWDVMKPVSEPKTGDFVYFTTYKAGPSHMGIYLGNGDFIHASGSKGITISNLSESYWTQHYIGTKRFLD